MNHGHALWQKVHVDLMGPFVKSHCGYSLILTIVCRFTKHLIAIRLRDKSAFSAAKNLVRQVFLAYIPVEIMIMAVSFAKHYRRP
jgi:hypothetical protein